MKLHVLGSNGWHGTSLANTGCFLVEMAEYYLVLDAGDGIYKLDEYATSDKPIYLFLSHFHLDHIIGFHTLPKFGFKQGIKIFGQPGTEKIMRQFVASPYTVPIERLKYKVEVHDIPEGKCNLDQVPVPVETGFLVHNDPCFGFRFELDGKVVSYCTDTGYCDNLVRLAKDADLLITECTLGAGVQPNPEWPHLNPELAARAAAEAGAKKMLLMHFGPGTYTSMEKREEAKVAAEKTFSPVVIASDGLALDI